MATRTILWAREIAHTEENNYRREAFEKRFQSKQLISETEIARQITGDPHKERAVKRFHELVSYAMIPENELVWPAENLDFLTRYVESQKWPQGWVDYFQKLFPQWQKLKRAMAQPKKKKPKKVLALT